VAVGPNTSQAQNLSLPEQSFIREYAQPGEPTMTVYMWGNVGATGIWRVGRDIDLVEFLSAVQVPGIGQERVDIRQRLTLRVFRGGSGDRREVYNKRLDNILGEGAAYPDLQDGDVLLIEVRQRRRILSFRFISTLVGTASSITLLILRLTGSR